MPESRRTQRLRWLARMGPYGKAQVEGVRITSAWAFWYVQLYDEGDQARRDMLESAKMRQVLALLHEAAEGRGGWEVM